MALSVSLNKLVEVGLVIGSEGKLITQSLSYTYDRYDRGLCLDYSDVAAAYPYAKLNRFTLMNSTDRTNSGHVWHVRRHTWARQTKTHPYRGVRMSGMSDVF